jgi:hypothetical protein
MKPFALSSCSMFTLHVQARTLRHTRESQHTGCGWQESGNDSFLHDATTKSRWYKFACNKFASLDVCR